ncbi:MAG: ester cyclase [Anaerolineae bacterium]
MSAEQNKSIVRRWVQEGWNSHNPAVADQFYTTDYVQHDAGQPPLQGREALKQYVGMFLTGFPDLHFSTDELIAEGDRVVWRFTSTATQTGPFMGIPPTGKRGVVPGIVVFRFEDSRIAEGWVNIDALGLLQQLGVIPMPGQPPA